MEDFKSPDEQAEFNNAFAFLERLNKFEYMIEEGLMSWRLVNTYYILESYENELCFCFKKDDQKEIDEIKEKIITIINSNPRIGNKIKNDDGKSIIAGSNNIGTLRGYLIQLNKKLRGIKYARGMGMPTRGQGKLF